MFTQDKTLLTGDFTSLTNEVTPFPIFDESILSFFQALSHRLRQNPEVKSHPDLTAFAFWCRLKNLERLKTKWNTQELRFGRGLAFHVCPGNVPLNFAYSLAAGLLAGCPCAVRLSSRNFPQADLLCREIDSLLRSDFRSLIPFITCFQCEHNHPILAQLSEQCRVRVLWGGDQAIRQIRLLPLSPRALELTFASRYSVCAIDAAAFTCDSHPEQLAERFYADAFFAGQWACTSPRVLLWLGEPAQIKTAQTMLWERIEQLCRQNGEFLPVHAVKKREHFCRMAAQNSEIRLAGINNYAVRVTTQELTPELLDLWTGDGMFLEASSHSLDALLPILGERCQTLCYYGITPKELREFLLCTHPRGCDRILPLGNSMQFSLLWDGIDLICSMSRSIEIQNE